MSPRLLILADIGSVLPCWDWYSRLHLAVLLPSLRICCCCWYSHYLLIRTIRVVLPSLSWYRGVTTKFVEFLLSLLTFTLLTHANNPGGRTWLELVKRRCYQVHGYCCRHCWYRHYWSLWAVRTVLPTLLSLVDSSDGLTDITEPCGQFGRSYRHYWALWTVRTVLPTLPGLGLVQHTRQQLYCRVSCSS